VGQIAKDYSLWFHVDGAHGASFLFSDKHRHILDGIDLADSVAWDAHKMLFVPALCTYLFYRDAKHSWEAFSQDAPYLFDPSDPQGMADFDSGLRTFECTKGAMSLGLWGVWSLYGKEFIASLIEKGLENTRLLYEKISKTNDFETAHEPQCNILCFRYLPTGHKNLSASDLSSLQQKIRQQLLHDGQGYITGTKLDGEYWLRVTVINPLTDESHLSALLEKIRALAGAIAL
jgi:L-2,4-diaminobutyrate decarboxylase